MTATLEAMRELASQIFAETDCAECPVAEVKRPMAKVQSPKSPKLSNGYRWGLKPKPRRGIKPQPKARAGEIRLVDFINAEMTRCGVSKMVVYARLVSGKYPGVTMRKANRRVTFISGDVAAPALLMVNEAKPGEVTLKKFVESESARTGRTDRAIYVRLSRGKYPGLEFRRVNQRVVFVKQKPVDSVNVLRVESKAA